MSGGHFSPLYYHRPEPLVIRLRHVYRASVDYTVDDDERVVEELGGQPVSAYRGDSGVAGLRGVMEAVGRGSGKRSPPDLPYTG